MNPLRGLCKKADMLPRSVEVARQGGLGCSCSEAQFDVLRRAKTRLAIMQKRALFDIKPLEGYRHAAMRAAGTLHRRVFQQHD